MSALDFALDQARRRADFYQECAMKAAQSSAGEGAILAQLAASRGAGSGAFTQSTSLQQHAEQYRHFTGWVYGCVRWVAQRIARQPFRAAIHAKAPPSRRPKKNTLPGYLKDYHQNLELLETHPALEVLEEPNELFTKFMLVYVTVVSMELTGQAYWWIYDAPKKSQFAGRKVIWPLPSNWVEPNHEKGLFAAWKVRPEGTREEIDVHGEEIVRFFYPDPANPLGCISPLQAMARAVTADESISELQRRTFMNEIWPGLCLTIGRNPDLKTPGVSSEQPVLGANQRAQIIAAVKNAYAGVQRYGEPLILDGLIQDVKRISNSPRELDFMNSGKYTKERITQGYGVNPVLLGQVEGANRASALVAEQIAISNKVNPLIELLSGVASKKVAPLFSDDRQRLLLFVEEAEVADPDTERADREALKKTGGLSINEDRQANGLPPIHGGDICIVSAASKPIHVIREDEPEPDGAATFPGEPEPPPPPAAPPFGGGPPKPGQEQPLIGAPEEENAAKFADADAFADWCYRPRKGKRKVKGLVSSPSYLSLAKSLGRAATLDFMVKAQDGSRKLLQEAMQNYFLSLGVRVRGQLQDTHKRGATLSPEAVRQAVSPANVRDGAKLAAKAPALRIVLEGAVAEWELHRPRRLREMSVRAADPCRDEHGQFSSCGTGGGSETKPEPAVVGRGSTGDVVRVGDEVVKNATRNEGKIYQELAGVEGVAQGRQEGDKIIVPYFPKVVSVDTVAAKDRKSYGPVLKTNLPRLVNAVTALSEAGYDYNDPIQVGFDKSKSSYLFDFSAANKDGNATRNNLSHLATYLDQFGLDRHGSAVRQAGAVLDYVNDPGVREFDSDSHEAKDAEKVAAHLDGKLPRYAYYAFNARTIPGVAQTDHRNGAKIVFTDKTLSNEFMSQWELHPAVHRSSGKAKSSWVYTLKDSATDRLRVKLPQNVRNAVDDYAADLLKQSWWQDLGEGVVEDLVEALKEGVKEGLSGDELAGKVMEVLGPEASKSRAENIAQTEGTALTNSGHQATREELSEMGISSKKEWAGIIDGSIREDHEEANGQQVGVDEMFEVGGEQAMFPGDQDLSPANRCGCRCVALTIVDDETESKSLKAITNVSLGKEADEAGREKIKLVADVLLQVLGADAFDLLPEHIKEACRDDHGRFSSCGDSGDTSVADKPAKVATREDVLEHIGRVKKDPTPKGVAELASKLGTMKLSELQSLKRELGIWAGGNKTQLASKLADLATKRLVFRQEQDRLARAANVKPPELHSQARVEKQLHDEVADRAQAAIARARELYRHYNDGKRLTRNNNAFRGGDLAGIPAFDVITSSVAKSFPDVLGAHGHGDSGRMGEDSGTAAQRLYDLLNAPPQRMRKADAYESALSYLVKRGRQSHAEAAPF